MHYWFGTLFTHVIVYSWIESTVIFLKFCPWMEGGWHTLVGIAGMSGNPYQQVVMLCVAETLINIIIILTIII